MPTYTLVYKPYLKDKPIMELPPNHDLFIVECEAAHLEQQGFTTLILQNPSWATIMRQRKASNVN